MDNNNIFCDLTYYIDPPWLKEIYVSCSLILDYIFYIFHNTIKIVVQILFCDMMFHF